MFVKLCVLVIILRPIECQKVLEFSSFTDDTFTDFDGWNLMIVEQQGSGIDKPPSETQSYFGFNSIYWDKSKVSYIPFKGLNLYLGMIKYYNNLKPHKALIVSFQIYIYNYSLNPGGNCQIQFIVNGFKQFQIQPNFNQAQRILKYNAELSISHTFQSVLIQFTGKVDDADKLTYGIRDFYLYSIPCPINCQQCKLTDQQEHQCIDWQLSSQSLVEIDRNLFNSDGWQTIQASSNQVIHQYSDCSSENINLMQILGDLGMRDQIRKTIILEPHYRIKIQYLHIVKQQAYALTTFWYGQLKGKTEYLVEYRIQTSSTTPICSRIIDKTDGDLTKYVEYESFHQDTIVEFQTQPSQSLDEKTRWGIRDFQVWVKKCHPSCQHSCSGPKESQCQNIWFPKFILIADNLKLITFSDDEEWQVENTFKFTQPNECNNQALLGGYNNLQGYHFIQSVYDLKTHIKIGISFKIYYIDQFNNDILFVAIDGIIVYQYTIPSTIDSKKDMPYCGVYTQIDQLMKITIVSIPHTRNQAIIQIYTNQPDTSTAYWGIREFTLTVNGFPYQKNLKDVKFSNDNISPWWIILKNSPIWQCGSQSFIGGSNALDKDSFLRKNFNNIPPHIQIRISYSIVTIQTSLRQTQFIIVQQINDLQKQENLLIQDKKYCGGTEYTHIFKFDYILDNQDDAIFMMISINEMDAGEFWGLRDFQLSYNNIKEP